MRFKNGQRGGYFIKTAEKDVIKQFNQENCLLWQERNQDHQ